MDSGVTATGFLRVSPSFVAAITGEEAVDEFDLLSAAEHPATNRVNVRIKNVFRMSY
jgi:hypothetical protein